MRQFNAIVHLFAAFLFVALGSGECHVRFVSYLRACVSLERAKPHLGILPYRRTVTRDSLPRLLISLFSESALFSCKFHRSDSRSLRNQHSPLCARRMRGEATFCRANKELLFALGVYFANSRLYLTSFNSCLSPKIVCHFLFQIRNVVSSGVDSWIYRNSSTTRHQRRQFNRSESSCSAVGLRHQTRQSCCEVKTIIS